MVRKIVCLGFFFRLLPSRLKTFPYLPLNFSKPTLILAKLRPCAATPLSGRLSLTVCKSLCLEETASVATGEKCGHGDLPRNARHGAVAQPHPARGGNSYSPTLAASLVTGQTDTI